MDIKKDYSMAELRTAARQQKLVGLYTPTNREIPPLTWVWVGGYIGQDLKGPVLGVILEIHKWRNNLSSEMKRFYVVLTTKGQISVERHNLTFATTKEVHNAEVTSATDEIKDTIRTALESGPSETNTLHYIKAAYTLYMLGLDFVDVPVYSVGITKMRVNLTSPDYTPAVILTGHASGSLVLKN